MHEIVVSHKKRSRSSIRCGFEAFRKTDVGIGWIDSGARIHNAMPAVALYRANKKSRAAVLRRAAFVDDFLEGKNQIFSLMRADLPDRWRR